MPLSLLLLLFLDLPSVAGTKENINERPGDYELIFTEELRFDGRLPNDDFNIFAGQVIYLDVNNAGDFFIGDYINQRIMQFDEDGVFIRYVAVQGQGPGEVQYLAGLQILEDGGLAFLNREGGSTSAELFNSDLKFLKREALHRPGFGVNSIKFSPNGKFIESEFRVTDNEKVTIDLKTGLFDRDMNLIHLVSSTHHQRAGMMTPKDAFWVRFFTYISELSLSNKGMLAFNNKSELFIAERRTYKVTRYDENLKPDLIFGRKIKPKLYTDEEIERFAKSMYELYFMNMAEQFRPYITMANAMKGVKNANLDMIKPVLLDLIPMEDGMLMAITEDDQIQRKQTADIFDRQGVYLCSVTMKDFPFLGEEGNTRMVFKNGKAYTIISKEDGSNHAVRYGYQLIKK